MPLGPWLLAAAVHSCCAYRVFLTSTCEPLACGCAERLESVPQSHQFASRVMYHSTVCLRPSWFGVGFGFGSGSGSG